MDGIGSGIYATRIDPPSGDVSCIAFDMETRSISFSHELGFVVTTELPRDELSAERALTTVVLLKIRGATEGPQEEGVHDSPQRLLLVGGGGS